MHPGRPNKEEDEVPKTSAEGKKTIEGMLTDPTIATKTRVQMLRQVAEADGEAERHVLSHVLEAASVGDSGHQFIEKTKELAKRVTELAQGPLRCATFDALETSAVLGRRARVILPDGGMAFCAVPEDSLADALRCGDSVWLDAQGLAVLYRHVDLNRLGEEGRLERLLPGGDVEVSLGQLGQYVFRPAAQLQDQLAAGEAELGCTVVVCPRQRLAWRALPAADGEGRLRFLATQPPPDVLVERDVGAPPAFLETIPRHIRRELTAPEIGARFRLRRSLMLLATGVAGSGKSHAIKALWRRLYEVMAEVVGVDIDELPQRVFVLESAEVLSKWLGDTDQNIARFFDEVAQVAREPFVAPDGTEWELPVLVICEEIDALARQRGEDSIHDRIQTTLLTKLDPAQALFEDRPVVVVCTTNIPSALDVAFVRRAGGTVATFGRVGRFDFRAILGKHLRDRPIEGGEEGCRGIQAELTSWLFAPNSPDPGLVELTFVGRPNAVTKHRRDFVTAGLIDRAVQEASREASDGQWESGDETSLTGEKLMEAIDDQVRSVVGQLSAENCHNYLDLPDAVRVASVRRVPQPAMLPAALQRAS
jgi:hypothetical protein